MRHIYTWKDIADGFREAGVLTGDTILVHSSFRSLGTVEGGAQAVIDGIESVIGREGTLVMPTLSQVDFYNSYKTWYMDKPSDVGYLTEYFRKQIYVYRSDQETHSVAARGRLAYELTKEHKAYGPHLCPFGEYAFADSSPWQKLYGMNAKVLFLGTTMRANTMKHMVEARLMENWLNGVRDEEKKARLLAEVSNFDTQRDGIWPYYDAEKMQEFLSARGLVTYVRCGDAQLICTESAVCCDAAYDILNENPGGFFSGELLSWIERCQA